MLKQGKDSVSPSIDFRLETHSSVGVVLPLVLSEIPILRLLMLMSLPPYVISQIKNSIE